MDRGGDGSAGWDELRLINVTGIWFVPFGVEMGEAVLIVKLLGFLIIACSLTCGEESELNEEVTEEEVTEGLRTAKGVLLVEPTSALETVDAVGVKTELGGEVDSIWVLAAWRAANTADGVGSVDLFTTLTIRAPVDRLELLGEVAWE